MATDDQYTNLYNKKILPFDHIGAKFLDYLIGQVRGCGADTYTSDAVLGASLVPVSGTTLNRINIAVGQAFTGVTGTGRRIRCNATDSRLQAIKVPPVVAVYTVGIESNDVENGIEVNPRTGLFQYVSMLESMGRVATPNAVVDNGDGTITLTVDSLFQAGDDHSGRSIRVWLKPIEKGGIGPQSGSPSIAIQTVVSTFSGGSNKVTVQQRLGQTNVSVIATNYVVQAVGPTVTRKSVEDLALTVGCLYLADVTGVTAGNTITTVDNTHQNLSISLSDADARLLAIEAKLAPERINVKWYGAKGDGSTPDRNAIQAAIDANPGRTIYFPKGKYMVATTIFIANRSTHLIGDFGARNSGGGTEICYLGTGPAIQLGVDNGHAWNAVDYDGPQDQAIEHIWLSHGNPDTILTSDGSGTIPRYKAGAYGIWDWRSGGLLVRQVGVEGFEANFVGIESDINRFEKIDSLYSKYGWYFGPRSDQNTMVDMMSFFCDRAVTIDGAGNTRFQTCEWQFCGNDTASTIEIRQGSHGVVISDCWIERSGAGYQGLHAQSFISAGEVAGYGPGGSVSSPGPSPNTTAINGCFIKSMHCYTVLPGVAGHTDSMVTIGKCKQLVIEHPTPYINGNHNFDQFVEVQTGVTANAADNWVVWIGDDRPANRIFVNSGLGDLNFGNGVMGFSHGNDTTVLGDMIIGESASRVHSVRGTMSWSQGPQAGGLYHTFTNSNTGVAVATTLLRSRQDGSFDTTSGSFNAVTHQIQAIASRSAGAGTLRNIALQCQAANAQDNRAIETTTGDVQLNVTSGLTFFNQAFKGVGTRAAAPSTGAHVVGEVVFNADPIAGGRAGRICVTAGTPGTWEEFGNIQSGGPDRMFISSANAQLTSIGLAAGAGIATFDGTAWFFNTSGGGQGPVFDVPLVSGKTIASIKLYITKTSGAGTMSFTYTIRNMTTGATVATATANQTATTTSPITITASLPVTIADDYHMTIATQGGGTAGDSIRGVGVFFA